MVGSQKILAGGDVNQNITYNSETKIYHQNENSEKENTYRKMVTKCFENDHILDRTERQFLDAEALKIGLSTETKNKIEAEVRSISVSDEDEKLSSVDVARFSRAKDALKFGGDPKIAYDSIKGLEVAYPNNSEIFELYTNILSEIDPEKGLSYLKNSSFAKFDSALKYILFIELNDIIGNEGDATQEERKALRVFANSPAELQMIRAKSLERLIDRYFQGESRKLVSIDLEKFAEGFSKSLTYDHPYLRFVHAYLDRFKGKRENLIPIDEKEKFNLYLAKKVRLMPVLSTYLEGTYSGDTFEGKPSGMGVWKGSDGTTYKGEWSNGKFHGKGKERKPNGDSYEGQYLGGDLDGFGKYSSNDGHKYEGLFVKGNRTGFGKEWYPSGDRYEGEFKDGLRHGEGKMWFSKGDLYEGLFEKGNRTGFGKEWYPSGDRYEGEFKDGLRHGEGKMWFSKGGRYEGSFELGIRVGNGQEWNESGDRLEGVFEDGKLSGQGKIFYSDGDLYEGEFLNSLPHGSGHFDHAKSKIRIKGDWKHGELQEDTQKLIKNSHVSPLLAGISTALIGPFGFFLFSTRAFIFAVCFYGLGIFFASQNGRNWEGVLLLTHLFAIFIASFVARTGNDD